eukprot:UN03582
MILYYILFYIFSNFCLRCIFFIIIINFFNLCWGICLMMTCIIIIIIITTIIIIIVIIIIKIICKTMTAKTTKTNWALTKWHTT